MKEMKDSKKMSDMPEKKNEHPIAMAVVCFVMAVFFIVGGIYFNESVLEIILSVAMSLFLISLGVVLIYGTIFLKKTDTEMYTIDHALRHKGREFYRKEQKKFRRKNDDIFHILHRYSVHKHVPLSLFFLLLVLLLGIAFYLNYDYGPESRMAMYVIGAIVGIYFIIHIAYLLFGGYVKQFKKNIIQSGYDMTDLNEDFKNGTTFCVSSGVINIGWKYSLYFHFEDKKQSFVLVNGKIKVVEKRLRNREHPAGEKAPESIIYVCIRICMEHGWFEIQTKDIVADMILEEFQLRGIEINKINEITGARMKE